MHPSDVKYALSTFTFSVQANDCRGTHHAFHTRAHAHAGTHKNEVEYACSKFICSVQANARSCKHIHGRTHTCIHTQHACSKSPFSVYASARRCTHIHSSTHTRTHPYTRMLLHAPEQCRIRMPRIHVFDSSKRLRRDTHTRIHACWFTHINCTRQGLRARTRMT